MKKRNICVAVEPDLKEKIDTTASDMNTSKSAYVRLAVKEKLNDDGNKPARIAASVQLMNTINELRGKIDEATYKKVCEDTQTLMAFMDRGGEL